jgi:hypothetical protein
MAEFPATFPSHIEKVARFFGSFASRLLPPLLRHAVCSSDRRKFKINMKMNAGWAKTVNGLALGLSLGVVVAVCSGCGASEEKTVSAKSRPEPENKIKPEEKPYIDAAKSFVEAVAARDYRKAYESLSSHARERVSPSQFVAPEDDATEKRNEAAIVRGLTVEQFTKMLAPTEKEYGKPTKLLNLYVFSTDPVALGGKGTSAENKLDSMFAIGMMPESVPVNIRKASVRSKILVELSPEQVSQAAKAQQTTPDKLKSDPDFQPYLNLKVVLVEEAGALKVGYFEFLPPGLLD